MVDHLPTPCLVLDLEVLERNLERMARHAQQLGVTLRPHVKTHKSIEIACRQRQLGAAGLTVSTLEEARVFFEAGFPDLTWAFPLILGRLPEVRDLVERGARLGVLVDSKEAVEALEEGGFACRVWLKVDAGYHRAGVDPDGVLGLELARRLHGSSRLYFEGLLSHSGQAYHAAGTEARRRAAGEEARTMARFAARLRVEGIEVRQVSVGSTPGTIACQRLDGISEVRPGNYAFFDATQVALGSCGVEDCALTVVASVVSCQPGARHSVVDAGALALSKDAGLEGAEPATFGRIFEADERGRLSGRVWISSLSQEHGIVNAALPVGAKVRILPNHSCLVPPNFSHYTVVRGDAVVGRWPILPALKHGASELLAGT